MLKNIKDPKKLMIKLINPTLGLLAFIGTLILLDSDGVRNLSSSLHSSRFIIAIFSALTVYLYSLTMKKDKKNYVEKGTEYGSAKWGTKEDIKPFVDEEPDNNIILTNTESLTVNPRPSQVEYARNKHVMVIGGSGSGKTRFYIKPNLMQCQSKLFPVSFVITDPKGSATRL